MKTALKTKTLEDNSPYTGDFPVFFKGRPIERRLLIILTIIFLTAVYILHISELSLDKYDPSAAGFVILLSFWGLHLFLVFKKFKSDELFLPLTAFLTILGWLMVFRLNPQLAYKQMVWILLAESGLILWLYFVKDFRSLEDYKYLFLVGAVLLQGAVSVFGIEVNGARLWFDFGVFSFQPIELVKISLTIFLAAYLKQNREILAKPIDSNNWKLVLKYIVPLFLLWGAAETLLILQKDLGMALLLFGVFLGLFYAATQKTFITLGGIVLFSGAGYFLYRVFSHVQIRINNWLNPWESPLGTGYQMVQALYALAGGGLTGAGLGMGKPYYIPAVHTDYIFAAICEDLGLWGSYIVLGVFLVLIQRMFKTALRASDQFTSFLSLGLALMFATQVFVIIAGSTKMIPLTGITLPFISYGGSSLVSNFILLGIFFQASQPQKNIS